MSVVIALDAVESGVFKQQDARDPVGLWGAQGNLTGDATGGQVGARIQIPAAKRRNAVYTIYDASTANTGGATDTATAVAVRIFTGWPDINLEAGIQTHETIRFVQLEPDGGFIPPVFGPREPLITPNQRFMLIFTPSVQFATTAFVMLIIDRAANVNNALYQFSAWGYYWNRDVLGVPGGPRHPGSQ